MAYLWLLRGILSIQRIEKYIIEEITPKTGLRWAITIQAKGDRRRPRTINESEAATEMIQSEIDEQTDKAEPFTTNEKVNAVKRKRCALCGIIKKMLRGIADQSFYSLIYHSVYAISALVFFLIMWIPSWVYGNISFQGQNIPLNHVQIINQVPTITRYWLTGIASVIAVGWYVSVGAFWIWRSRRRIDEQNKDLEETAIKVFQQINRSELGTTNDQNNNEE